MFSTLAPIAHEYPVCISDAYVAERQKFHLLFLPGRTEPLRFRLLDDAINTISVEGYRQFQLHTYSFVTNVAIVTIRTPGELRAWYDPATEEKP